MRKRVLLSVLLVLALLATSGCSLIVKDEEVDKQTVIIEVAGQTFTKGEVQEQTEYLLDYYEYMYSMYGMPFDRNDASTFTSVRQEAIDSIVQTAVAEKKIAEMGLDQFSEEETAEIQAMVDEQYNSYAEFVKGYALADTELTGDELQAAIDEQMEAMGYGTKEDMLRLERMTRAQERLRAELNKEVDVSEEELISEYSYRMENAKATYTAYPDSYGVDLTNGTIGMYYAPAGYRNVKHILVSFAEEDQAVIDGLNSDLADKQNELTTAQASLAALDPDASKDDEDTAANRAVLTAAVENLPGEIAALEADVAAATEKAAAAIQLTIDEIQAKLAAGEDFNALIDEYNQDPGMTSDSVGYAVSAVSTNWVPEFTKASMALAAIGDVSAPVQSSYGIHIIQYASDIPEGEIGFETVREELYSELLESKQEYHYSDVMQSWGENSGAKIYEDRL